ncbi:MAG: NADP-dependent 3-hydroxy acid dehydrogenase YdfG [Candidatus Pelagisphaera sp.]|jgi:NADP-dependent 3-hydroxy acid dehydrogenase YdfG|nr:SDR family oxidoreductase [Bacteroidetes Order II. bacterium]MBT5170317.1 SDR family oxidoreductase [Opitutales bacterium]MBT6379371.1 SDR family oxidoreductase [Opitutales bacterium]
MNAFKNQVAIITGASSGIGQGVARALGERGMRLILTGRQSEKLDALAIEIGIDHCATLAADMANPATSDQLISLALARFGRCDVVFNGAGVMYAASIEQSDMDQMCEMVQVNVEGFTRVCYAALKHFRSVGSGHLINVSSILGTKVRPNTGVYAGSKFYVEALSEALRMEVAKSDLKVSVIQPGVVDTNLQTHFETPPRKVLGIENVLQPEDIARCVCFILEQPAHVRIPVMMALPGEQAM